MVSQSSAVLLPGFPGQPTNSLKQSFFKGKYQMDKHPQSWVYRCAEPRCGLTGVVNESELRGLEASGPVTCQYSGHKMDRIRKAAAEDLKSLEPLTPVVRKAGGPIILQADPWWPMEHIQVITTRIFFGLESVSYPTEYVRPGNLCQAYGETVPRDDERPSEYLTEEDVARHFNVSVRVVRRWVSKKRLRPIRLTKRTRVFTWALIDEFLMREAGGLEKLDLVNQPARDQPFRPTRRSMSLDESRALLRDLKEKR